MTRGGLGTRSRSPGFVNNWEEEGHAIFHVVATSPLPLQCRFLNGFPVALRPLPPDLLSLCRDRRNRGSRRARSIHDGRREM